LQHLVSLFQTAAQEKSYEKWLRRQFIEADKDKSNSLCFSEVMKLLKQLNMFMDKQEAESRFIKANTSETKVNAQGEQVLDEDEFVTFYFELMKRNDVAEIFKT